MHERWFGATGRRVPQLAVEGELDLDGALVLDELDLEQIAAAFDEGRPIVIRADTEQAVVDALRRPEVSSVIAPPELVDLDLVELTYGP
ncbi:MAG TPA: hypothetical protein VF236_08315 [Gaiellaceae bacterium]